MPSTSESVSQCPFAFSATAPAVAKAENFHSCFGAFFNNAANNCVKSRTVAAAGQNAYLSHVVFSFLCLYNVLPDGESKSMGVSDEPAFAQQLENRV